MNKNAVREYAIWARNELISKVTQKAFEYGVSENEIVDKNVDSIHGKLLSSLEKKQRNQLIDQVNKKGFSNVIEEVAYNWFNRLIALRYMEVNNYLPNKVRVFTDENNIFNPQILSEAIHLEMNNIDKNVIYEMIENNKREELYKYLLIAICDDMVQYLPGMFTPVSDYNGLLCPDDLLKNDSIIGRMISNIDEDSWQDQVQIIGWLYQYYVSEQHDRVIKMTGGAVKKEDIPAATQLFTTDWVVRYMVDNSLGRYWIERNPNSSLKEKLEFLVTPKSGSFSAILSPISPEEMSFIDPCMGSGHILVYAFDVLMEIYREYGYSDRDAAVSIVENNLFGIDIDERAYQLSYFALMMKARQYNRRALTIGIKNNVVGIIETNALRSYKYDGMPYDKEMDKIGTYLIDVFKDAKELGSLIEVKNLQYCNFESWIDEIHENADSSLDFYEWDEFVYPQLKLLVKQARILSRKYISVTTNPPYLSKMEGNLKRFVLDYYKDYSSDLFSVFMKRNFLLAKEDGYLGFMTPFVWMFIKSYEKLREFIINNKSIATLCQMEYSAYEEATVPICSFVLENTNIDRTGCYFRLANFKGGMSIQRDKVLEAIQSSKCDYFFERKMENLSKIPGYIIAYWIDKKAIEKFADYSIRNNMKGSVGIQTGDNEKFIRLWWEAQYSQIKRTCKKMEDSFDSHKWFPYNKGGEYRKWYGNDFHVVFWQNDGDYLKKDNEKNKHHWQQYLNDLKFSPMVTWSRISAGIPSFRFKNSGFLSDMAGFSIFADNDLLLNFLGFANSCVAKYYLDFLAPTINIMLGQVLSLPYDIRLNSHKQTDIVNNCINYARLDWDSFETSWDFKTHPLVEMSKGLWDATAIGASMYKYYGYNPEVNCSLELCYMLWQGMCNDRFNQLKANEEELNRIFIDIYGLQDVLTPEVEDKDVTVRKADLTRDIKSLISYAVGCIFGRYSLAEEGLAYAGGDWNPHKYGSYVPVNDNCIPITDDEYFENDIVSRFVEFIKQTFGEEDLEDNLKYIASVLGGNGTPRQIIRNYFLNDFFKDHCNTYQVTGSGKRPIYWQFDSGKKNGFKCLMYIHRYTPDQIAKIRTEYVLPLQSKYRNTIDMLEKQIEFASTTAEKVKLTKELNKIKDQALELKQYEEKIHHWADKMEPMDLDDGVKVNYAKFQELLAKIK